MKVTDYAITFLSMPLFIGLIYMGCKSTDNPAANAHNKLSAYSIMAEAHQKAGGKSWVNPKSLFLEGYGLFYSDGDTAYHEKHRMWRVYASQKNNAHEANGMLRIESYKEGIPVFMISFDGTNTYDLSGKQEQSDADKRWASNFGYGVIRHAFDEGYRIIQLEDSMVNERATYRLKIVDLDQGETIFDIRQDDFAIVRVGFETPRGWHERVYSEFFQKEAYNWYQAGRVELFYNDEKSNEIFWTDFIVDDDYEAELFVIQDAKEKF